jgi:regulator of replication initiation timing
MSKLTRNVSSFVSSAKADLMMINRVGSKFENDLDAVNFEFPEIEPIEKYESKSLLTMFEDFEEQLNSKMNSLPSLKPIKEAVKEIKKENEEMEIKLNQIRQEKERLSKQVVKDRDDINRKKMDLIKQGDVEFFYLDKTNFKQLEKGNYSIFYQKALRLTLR